MILKDKIITVKTDTAVFKLHLTDRNTLWNRHYCSVQTLTFEPQYRTAPPLTQTGKYQTSLCSSRGSSAVLHLGFCLFVFGLQHFSLKKQETLPTLFRNKEISTSESSRAQAKQMKLILEDNVTSGTCQWALLCFLSKARVPIGNLAQCFARFLIIYSGCGSVSLGYQLLVMVLLESKTRGEKEILTVIPTILTLWAE